MHGLPGRQLRSRDHRRSPQESSRPMQSAAVAGKCRHLVCIGAQWVAVGEIVSAAGGKNWPRVRGHQRHVSTCKKHQTWPGVGLRALVRGCRGGEAHAIGGHA